MRRGLVILGALVFLGLMLALPVSAAATNIPVQGVAEVHGPARISGIVDGQLESSGVEMQWESAAEAGEASINVSSGRVLVVDFPVMRMHDETLGPGYRWEQDVPLEPRVLEDFDFTGSIWSADRPDDAYQLILPRYADHPLTVTAEQWPELRLGMPGNEGSLTRQRPSFGPVNGVDVQWTQPGPGAALAQGSREATLLEGQLAFLALGGTYVLEGAGEPSRSLETGEARDEQAFLASPDEGTRGGVVHQIALVVLGDQATVTLGAMPGSARVVISAVAVNVTGDVELTDVQAEVQVGDQPVSGHYALLHSIGEFRLEGDASELGGAWSLDGEASFVGLDAVTFYGSRDAHLLAIGVAGGISLALLWAILSKAGKELLAFVGLRNLADPLASDNRLDILRLITNNPGITVSMLCQETRLARATVQHHIGILARSDLVSRHQPGKMAHWTLNSGSLDVPAPDAGPGSIGPATLREAYAASGHPKRQLILETLAKLGEGHYGDLEQHWTTHGVAPLRQDEVSYHGKRLVEAGLVTRARRQGRTIWILSVASDETIALQLANFLRGQPAAEELVRLARAADPRSRSVPKHQVPTSRRARRQIRLLEGVGLLQPAPSGQGFVLASHADRVAERL